MPDNSLASNPANLEPVLYNRFKVIPSRSISPNHLKARIPMPLAATTFVRTVIFHARNAAASETAGRTTLSASLPALRLLSNFPNFFIALLSSAGRPSGSLSVLSSSSEPSSSLDSGEESPSSSSSRERRVGLRGGSFLSSLLSSFFFLSLSRRSWSSSSPPRSSSSGGPEP